MGTVTKRLAPLPLIKGFAQPAQGDLGEPKVIDSTVFRNLEVVVEKLDSLKACSSSASDILLSGGVLIPELCVAVSETSDTRSGTECVVSKDEFVNISRPSPLDLDGR